LPVIRKKTNPMPVDVETQNFFSGEQRERTKPKTIASMTQRRRSENAAEKRRSS